MMVMHPRLPQVRERISKDGGVDAKDLQDIRTRGLNRTTRLRFPMGSTSSLFGTTSTIAFPFLTSKGGIREADWWEEERNSGDKGSLLGVGGPEREIRGGGDAKEGARDSALLVVGKAIGGVCLISPEGWERPLDPLSADLGLAG